MNAVMLNGAGKDETLNTIYEITLNELRNKSWEADTFILRDMKISDCLGCFGCWVKSPGICVIDDAGREVAKKVIQSDLLVFLTPVTFGGYSSELKKAVDRLIPNISPFFTKIKGEIHHKRRYERFPCMLVLGVLPQPDAEKERIFKSMVARNELNMNPPVIMCGVYYSDQSSEEINKQISEFLSNVKLGAGNE